MNSPRLVPPVKPAASFRRTTRSKRLVLGLLPSFVLFWVEPSFAQDAPDFGAITGFIRWGGVVLSLFVLAGSALVMRLITTISERLNTRFANQRMMVQKFESFVRFLVYVVAAIIVLSLSVRLDPAALTVIGASLGFAIGFAMRDLVAAFIAGITIMFDRPFQVGDRVQYAGEYGDIIQIGLRSVRMNTLDDNIVTIPNNKVLTDVTSSGNYGALEMQVAMVFYVHVDQNLSQAIETIHEACITSRFCYLDRPVPIVVKQIVQGPYTAYQLKARPYVLDVKYEEPFTTDVHVRVQKAFLEARIYAPGSLHHDARLFETDEDAASATDH
jgi:small-conductance mechanosensitive channel